MKAKNANGSRSRYQVNEPWPFNWNKAQLDRWGASMYVREAGQRATPEMSMASSRTLMRLLIASFLLLLPGNTKERACISLQSHHPSHPGIAAADHSALLETAPVRIETTPACKYIANAQPPLLASEASVYDRRVQSTPAPTRDFLSLCSYEHNTAQAARPPPFQA
jgi:hypothetical protein